MHSLWTLMWLCGVLPITQLSPLQHQGTLTEGLRSPARVDVAPDGTILVSDTFHDHIARFTDAGAFLGTWSVPEGPIGVAAHPDGRYFVSRRDDARVAIYDGSFSFLGFLGDGVVTFERPTDLAVVTSSGRIYVIDSGADRVYAFDAGGTLVMMLGVRGTLSSQFKYPSAIGIDTAYERFLVADQDNFRVQIFGHSGIYQDRFGYRNIYLVGGGEEGWMPRGQGLTVDAAGHIYVADAFMGTVRIFDETGHELAKVIEYGSDPGDVRVPCDLELSNDGSSLYVVSTNTASVEIYETPDLSLMPAGAPATGTNRSTYDRLRSVQRRGGAVARSPAALGSRAARFLRSALTPRGEDPVDDRTTYEGPHMIEDPVICGRCHGIAAQPGGHPGLVEGQSVLCMSCHTAGGQALTQPVHELDLADPYATNPDAIDAQGRSHAWGVPAVNALADSIGPAAGSEMERYLDGGLMKCATCHNQHSNDAGSPYLRVSMTGDAMCKECHAPRDKAPGEGGTHPVGFAYPEGVGEFPPSGDLPPLVLQDGNVECTTCHAPHYADSGGANDGEGDGMLLRAANDETLCETCHTEHIVHTPAGPWQPTCTDCHDIHDPTNINLDLVATIVKNQTLDEDKPVVFLARTGPNSFADGDPTSIDGICEICHTSTNYHRYDGTGAPHNDAQDCIVCHPHGAGFMPTGGDCLACHSSPTDNGDGIPVGGRRAVVGEFPVGDAHAHYGVELTNGACTTCHSLGTHMDGYVELIDADSGDLYRFVQIEDLVTDPDVSDFCASCHDTDGAQRLPAPDDPFGNGNVAPDVDIKFQGTLQWIEWYADVCYGPEGTQRGVNSHHDISDADQAFSGAKIECLDCHGAHTAGSSQPLVDPFNTLTPWTGEENPFCLACHAGGNGPADPAFPANVIGPTIAMRGLDTCDYKPAPWYVDYTWTNAAHGMDSKRGWDGYSGAPNHDLGCTVCHDPHGSYSAGNTAGNPYMIRDFVDGTPFVDDGVRPGNNWTGPPWDTFGTARSVVVTVDGLDVGWGGSEGLCEVCHAYWQQAYGFHDMCTGCQTCHGHGQLWQNHDWGPAPNDSTPCPSDPLPPSTPTEGNLFYGPADSGDVLMPLHLNGDR